MSKSKIEFAEWVIEEAEKAKHWHESKGMRVARNPWLNPSVCIRLLREYELIKEKTSVEKKDGQEET